MQHAQEAHRSCLAMRGLSPRVLAYNSPVAGGAAGQGEAAGEQGSGHQEPHEGLGSPGHTAADAGRQQVRTSPALAALAVCVAKPVALPVPCLLARLLAAAAGLWRCRLQASAPRLPCVLEQGHGACSMSCNELLEPPTPQRHHCSTAGTGLACWPSGLMRHQAGPPYQTRGARTDASSHL